MMKKLYLFVSALAALCLLAGCGILVVEDDYSLSEIRGDITCEYRVGFDAQSSDQPVDVDIAFDKDRFVELFNEEASYDPFRIRKHPDQCDLVFHADADPDEWQAFLASEVNVKALFDDTYRSVSIYQYGEKLYLFVLCLGGGAAPEDEGYYYMQLSPEMDAYWHPILDAVRSAA